MCLSTSAWPGVVTEELLEADVLEIRPCEETEELLEADVPEIRLSGLVDLGVVPLGAGVGIEDGVADGAVAAAEEGAAVGRVVPPALQFSSSAV